MNTVTSVPVNVNLIHVNQHFDEMAARYFFRFYGEEKFPGALNSYVRYIEGNIHVPEAELDADGLIPIGCGPIGCRFNEHGIGQEEDRLPGECATTLILKYLGLEGRAEFKRLAEETLYYDTHSGCRSTQLPELVKVANRRLPTTPLAILDWATKLIAAIIEQEKFGFAAVAGEKTLLDFFEELVRDNTSYRENEQVYKYMLQQVQSSMFAIDKSVLELAHVVKCLQRSGHKAEDVADCIQFALNSMLADQSEFWTAVEDLRKLKPVKVWAMVNGRSMDLKLLVCQSDSRYAQKAARYLRNELVLVRNSSGNVQIFIDSRIRGLNIANLVRMIRFLEMPKGSKDVDWKALASPGAHPQVLNWYYHKAAENLFNGNESHTATPSRLMTDTLVHAIQHAFHPKPLGEWMRRKEVKLPEGSNSIASQHNVDIRPETKGPPGLNGQLEKLPRIDDEKAA